VVVPVNIPVVDEKTKNDYNAKAYRDYEQNKLSDVHMVTMNELLGKGLTDYTLNFNVVMILP